MNSSIVSSTKDYPPQKAVAAWLLFDWAAQPFFTLVTTFVFAPFFVSAIAASPAEGQSLWGYATGFAGLCIALFSPILGAIADQAGRRKPWIAVFGSLLIAGALLLWFAVPGHPLSVPIALTGFIMALIGAEFATLFNNAMMPSMVPPQKIGKLSGTGWAIGYLGGLLSLIIILGFFAANPSSGKTLLGFSPALGLDPASREGDRISGPFTAIWFLIFVMPMFLLVPDQPKRMRLHDAVGSGMSQLKASLSGLRQRKPLARFLLANMINADALVALFAFGGIYAAGTFGWSTIEIGIFGILLTITGALGAWIGGRLDDRFGSKTVIIGALLILIIACIGILGTTKTTLLYILPSIASGPNDGLFATLAERGYIGLGLLIGIAAGPVQAASRSMLIKLAPPKSIGQYFGIFALSGKVTSFIGPVLVAVATQMFSSQRAGLVVLLAMFSIGLMIMIKTDDRPDQLSKSGSESM
jgi:MFS transporter, UMF1 family